MGWFLCHAAYGFSLVIFGSIGLSTIASCDLIMTRFVIWCLVYFAGSPYSVVCAAAWMGAITTACQAVVGAVSADGKILTQKPSLRRMMLDDLSNSKRMGSARNF